MPRSVRAPYRMREERAAAGDGPPGVGRQVHGVFDPEAEEGGREGAGEASSGRESQAQASRLESGGGA
eukprot:1194494-Prorocentrum_minimum.AAC.2